VLEDAVSPLSRSIIPPKGVCDTDSGRREEKDAEENLGDVTSGLRAMDPLRSH
jgi:hypothetical protein